MMTVAACLAACRDGTTRQTPSSSSATQPTADTSRVDEPFVERARDAGLDFVHFNGMTGAFYYPEMFAPGVGLFDFDNDQDLDIYVVQGRPLGRGAVAADALIPSSTPLGDRLFRNDLTVAADGTSTLRFVDVTDASGIDIASYGMGVAVGDFDNDGWVDLYRTGVGSGVLLKNNGNGRFTDVTARTGTGNAGGWSVSASFADLDRDGWLDLFVGNYVDYAVERNVACVNRTGQRDYCPPSKYPPQMDRLYRNRRDGAFDDVTRRALVGGAHGPALGVLAVDADGDGWLDVYVGNDGLPNQLWINQRDGTFRDQAFRAGVAVSGGGAAEASMGLDAGDFDNDGDEDLFVTNWLSQMNVLYVSAGGVFEDRRAASGLGSPSLPKTGFGTAWIDYDNDGWLDLLTVNGGVAAIEAQARAKDPFPFRMTKQLYRNLGNGRFQDVSAQSGAVFTTADVGRGAAFGDVDNDGDTDVVVGNDAGRLQLLVNVVGNERHWVGLRLMDSAGVREATGARVRVARQGRPPLWRRSRTDGSYASANDGRILVGLGTEATPVDLQVVWPDGTAEDFPAVPVDRYTTLRQSGR